MDAPTAGRCWAIEELVNGRTLLIDALHGKHGHGQLSSLQQLKEVWPRLSAYWRSGEMSSGMMAMMRKACVHFGVREKLGTRMWLAARATPHHTREASNDTPNGASGQ